MRLKKIKRKNKTGTEANLIRHQAHTRIDAWINNAHDDMMDALRYDLWVQQNYVYRRVKWLDVLMDYGIAKVSLKHTLNFAWNALITMKDFLLIRSRSFYAPSVSTTSTLPSSKTGCTDKPAPSSNVVINTTGTIPKRSGYTSTTFSGGSLAKKPVSHRSGTKCYCGKPNKRGWDHTLNCCIGPGRKVRLKIPKDTCACTIEERSGWLHTRERCTKVG